MSITLMLGAGLIVGILAGWVGVRDERGRWFTYPALGAVGGLTAGLLGRTLGLYSAGSMFSVAVSVIGAAAFVLLYRAVSRASLAGA